jgi:hypothetical protein
MSSEDRLPVIATAVESFRFVLTHRRELLRLALVGVPAFYLLNIGFDSIDWRALSGRGVNATAGKALVDLGLRGVIATIVLVAWHRVVMLKVSAPNGLPPVALGMRECRYFFVWMLLSASFLAIFAITAAVAVAIQFVAMLGAYLALLLLGLGKTLVVGRSDQLMIVLWIAIFFAVPVASYVAGRLSLILPALAIDRRRPWRHAWRLSDGNGWRLVVTSLFVMIPLESAAALCGRAAMAMRGTVIYNPLLLAEAASVFLLVVLTGTVLSLFSLRLDAGQGDSRMVRAGVVPAE